METAQNGIFTPLYLLLFFDITAHHPASAHSKALIQRLGLALAPQAQRNEQR